MANETKRGKPKEPPTPRQLEIKRRREKGSEHRNDQESARLEQLVKEERRDRFMRLAVKRTQNASKQLRNVARMANRAVYDYTPEEAEKIVRHLAKEMDAVIDAFARKTQAEKGFSL